MRIMDTLRLIAGPDGFSFYDTARNKLNVVAGTVVLQHGQPPLFQIALPAGQVDIVGQACFATVDPESGRPRVVRRIEWADGAVTEFPAPEGTWKPNATQLDVKGAKGAGD